MTAIAIQSTGKNGWATVLWALALVAVAAALARVVVATDLMVPTFGVLILFGLIHGTLRYGVVNLLVFIAICLVVSNIYENASILTGFPFGNYHYTDSPKLFNVPLNVGPFYFAMGYTSWQVASVLLDGADAQLQRRINLFALPLVAAVLMTVIDLSIDGSTSTIGHFWIWHDGGGFYGVPYTNYLGWTLTTWTFYQLFAFYLARRPDAVRPAPARSFFALPVLGYASLGLHVVAMFTTAASGSVVDQAGVSWQIAHIHEAAFLCATYTVVFLSVLALVKIARGDLREIRIAG